MIYDYKKYKALNGALYFLCSNGIGYLWDNKNAKTSKEILSYLKDEIIHLIMQLFVNNDESCETKEMFENSRFLSHDFFLSKKNSFS